MKRQFGKNGQLLDAIKTPTHDDVIFAAGFYEGEGNCGRIQGKVTGLAVRVGQKDPEILYRLRDLFGGSISHRKPNGAAGCRLFCWLLSGDRARDFLVAIYPYLSLRRKEQICACDSVIQASVETVRQALVSQNEMKIQSGLHGNMQSPTEMLGPVIN